MMPNYQLAEKVTIAMEEANPAWLVELIETNKLVSFLTTRINEFKLQFVREMEGKPQGEELYVMESLMPMLTTFPHGKDRTPLTPTQRTMLETQLGEYEEAANVANNKAKINAGEAPAALSAELCDIDGQTKFANWININPNGSVSITSGEYGTSPDQFLGAEDHEQWVAVPAAAKDALLFALLKDKYAGNRSAVYDFKQYLTERGIPMNEDFWISFN